MLQSKVFVVKLEKLILLSGVFMPEGIRLAKYLCTNNVCSRREAERFISAGFVSVNGEVINTPVFFVQEKDEVIFKGKKVNNNEEKARLWLYYKPVGEITTHKDPQGRLTVFESLNKLGFQRVVSVGRLDINSEGLLLLTNKSSIANGLERPENNNLRVYKARVYGQFDFGKSMKFASAGDLAQNKMITLENVVIDKVRYAPFTIEFLADQDEIMKKNYWMKVKISEGKNREIRKILNWLGLQVNRLIRVQYGDYHLNSLQPGEIKETQIIQK